MKIMTPYKWRPLSTWAGIRQHPAKELAVCAILACRKMVSNRIWGSLWRLLRDADEFIAEKTPIEGMMVESIEKAPDNESAIVSTLMASFVAAKQRQSEMSGPYLPGADWKKILESQWSEPSRAINRQDIVVVAAFLRNFFRNEGLSGFWGGDRMFDTFATLDGYVSRRRADSMRRQFKTWLTASPEVPVTELNAPQIGNPWGYIIQGSLLYEPIFEYHYQAKYFASLLLEVAKPVMFEIGGGFGGLAYQIVKHVPGAKYIGFDLPENVLLQSYYLSCAFPDLKILTYDINMTALTRDTIERYDIILLPNFMIPHVESATADMVINVRSLSEMPLETICEYLRQIDRLGRFFFFHENIVQDRVDGLHGIPSSEFPVLCNFTLVAESESRWPRYKLDTGYACQENLYIHSSILRRGSTHTKGAKSESEAAT